MIFMSIRRKLVGETVDFAETERKDARMNGKLYRNTNEDLTRILSQYDLKGKNVCSVLASSDQYFSAYYNGASSVDTFDDNLLAYYYYYLKYWTLLYTGKHYIPADNKKLREIIEYHDDNLLENLAYKVWKDVLDRIGNFSLYYSNLFYRSGLDYHVPYENNPEELIKIIRGRTPNFKKINLYKKLDINKKYDVIILSNILEYMYEENNDEITLTVCNNLLNMLNDDGIIIASNVLNNKPSYDPIFESVFECDEGIVGRSVVCSYKEAPISYSYRKR